jgi:phosphate transport system substrate-binding protein
VVDTVLRGKPFGSWVRGEPVPSSVTQGVATDAGGLGFASIFYDNARSHPVALSRDGVNFVEPSYTNVINGTYPLSRGLHVAMNLPPGGALSAPMTEVISYILSRNGQELVSVDGNYPLTGEQIESSRRKLLPAPAASPGGPSTPTSPAPGPAAAAPAGGAPVNGGGQPK